MKQILFLFAFMLTFGLSANAQLKVDASGNVGIGTTAPAEALHVVGQVALENPGSNKNIISGTDGSQRLAMSTNATSSSSRAFFTMWGAETHASSPSPARAGELAIQCKYFQVSSNKPNNGFASLDFEVKADGDTYAYGDLYHNGTMIVSDRRLKDNIVNFNLGLEEIMQMNPKQYFYNGRAGTNTSRLHTGVIAQEFQQIVPEGVKTFNYDDNYNDVHEEYLAIDEGIIKFMLINAIQEQQAELDEKENRISELADQVSELKALVETIANRQNSEVLNIDLNGTQSVALGQNVPNPFKTETQIAYRIDQDFNKASMRVYDMAGRVIHEKPIVKSGTGVVNVNTHNMKVGTYTYSLVIDGKIQESKKMILSK